MKPIILCCLMSLLFACATPPQHLPPDQSMRVSFGAMAIQTQPFNQLGPITTPTRGTGEAAGSGAASGALGSIAAGISTCGAGEPVVCVVGTSVGVLLAPVAAVVGGVVGAVRSHPEEEVDQVMDAFRSALNEFGHEQRLEQLFFEHAKHNHVDVRLVANGINPEFDTQLELSFLEFKWNSLGRINPDLYLTAKLRARLVDLGQNQELYLREWAFKGSTRPLYELAEDDAAGLTQEMEQALTAISNQMVHDLFISQSSVRDFAGFQPENLVTTTRVMAYRELEPPASSLTQSQALAKTSERSQSCEQTDGWSDDYESPNMRVESHEGCTSPFPYSTEKALSL